MKIDVGTVSSPGCSNTIVGARFSPSASQKALPNAFAPPDHRANASLSVQCGSWPQWSKFFRLTKPTAPSFLQNSPFSSLDTTATGFPPASRTIWMAIEPSPPAPPHTRTGSPSATTFGGHPCSIRYAVAPTSVGAAACSHVRCGAFGMHWWAWTLVNWANDPQFDSYPQIRYVSENPGSSPPLICGSSTSHWPQ